MDIVVEVVVGLLVVVVVVLLVVVVASVEGGEYLVDTTNGTEMLKLDLGI